MKTFRVLIINILYGVVTNVNKYDFGLFENEPLLLDLHSEDIQLTSNLAEVNKDLKSEEISKFLKKEEISPETSYIEHPINVFHLIKKHTLAFNGLLLRTGPGRVRDKLEQLKNETVLIRTLQTDDLKKSMNALAVMIHSHDMDVDIFSKGEIPANKYGNGESPLIASRVLTANDLGNIAIRAIEYGFIGTGTVILKSAINAPRAYEDENFEKMFAKILKDTQKLHNGYLEKHKSIYTDSYSLKPYLIDEDMKKKKKQPKFIKAGDHINLLKMGDSLRNDDAQYARTSYMLQSCGKFKIHNHHMFTQKKAWSTPEPDNHKCVLVHHGNPFTKLGPFKIEIVYHSPFFMIIHELFTEEDINFLVDWARPRLSRTRQIVLAEDNGRRPKNEWRTRKTVRTVHKSVQAWLYERVYDNKSDVYDKSHTVPHPRPINLARRIERAVRMNVTDKYSSVPYQVTSYGLGGLCEDHNDPYGYNIGKELTPDRAELVHSGDIFGTVMGWLSHTPAGGATTFFANDRPLLIWPTRGAAAFWFGLNSDGSKDGAVYHGGCPVISGSKWILNKWVNTFDQFNKYPCSRYRKVKIQPWAKSSFW